MKKTRSFSPALFLIASFLLAVFVGSVGFSIAYFSSKESKSGDINFHDIVLEINSENSDDAIFSSTLTALPGDTLDFSSVSVKNAGTADVYAILKLEVKFTKVDTTETSDVKWYNLTNTETEINTANLIANTVGATELAKKASQKLSLTYDLDGTIFNDDYKNATIQVVITAYSIQKDNLQTIDEITDKALIATYMLVNDYNK